MSRPSQPASSSKAAAANPTITLPVANHAPKQKAAPSSFASLVLPQDFDAAAGVESLMLTVPVRKPTKLAFVRVHPSPEFRAALAILRDDNGDMYAVHPTVYPYLTNEASPAMLYTTQDEGGTVFLWPVTLPGPDGRTNTWSQSAHAAAQAAQTDWLRVSSRRDAQMYGTTKSKVSRPDPKWPEKSFEDLLRVAFDDGRLIDSLDHPIVRRLQGEV